MAKDPSSTESGVNNQFLQRAYALTDPHAAKTLYDEWAGSYDKDLNAQEYASPQRTVEAVLRNIGNDAGQIKILDAGCGTGLVGVCFANSELSGRLIIDGLDITEGMLLEARKKGVYHDLEPADLTKPIKRPDSSYDVVTCVGTLTKGHVGPTVLNEFARVTSEGGLIVATVHDEIWEVGGYKTQVEALRREEVVTVISTDEFGILESYSTGGRMVVLKKT